jgi:hypothetical protein
MEVFEGSDFLLCGHKDKLDSGIAVVVTEDGADGHVVGTLAKATLVINAGDLDALEAGNHLRPIALNRRPRRAAAPEEPLSEECFLM